MLDAKEAHLLSRCGNEIEKLDRDIDKHIRTAASNGDYRVTVGYRHTYYDVNYIAQEIYERLLKKGYQVELDVSCDNEYEAIGHGSFFSHRHLIKPHYTARFDIRWY